MKKSSYIIPFACALILIFSLYGAQSWARERVYQMRGEVTAIDLQYNTVVVEVPMAGSLATVGGPLSTGAVLERAGKSVDLASFKVGDRVLVKWKVTEEGHVILGLKAK
jgi:hypothetical protein